MGFFLNILVIILAVIAFLIIYYITLNKDRKSQDYHLPFKKIRNDYEFGEENGVDLKTMSENKIEANSQENLFAEKELSMDSGSSEIAYKSNESQWHNEQNEIKQEEYQLKNKYGKNFIRIFNRDPYHLFTYWEINNPDYYNNTPYLRLNNEKYNSYDDIEINHYSSDWYLDCQPDNDYRVSIGYKKDGIFYPLLTSRKIRTPLDRPSNIIDEHWMTIEELSHYSYRIEMDTLSLIKSIEGRKIQEELEADSLTLVQK